MTDYFCRGRVRLVFVVMLLVFGGAFVAFFLSPVFSLLPGLSMREGGSIGHRMAVMFPLGLLFGGAAFAGLWGLLWSFTVYRLDENGIVKRGWNGGTQEFAWRELVHAEPTQDGSGTLTDFRGNRMTIPSSEFGYRSKAGRSLHDALAERLATVPEEVKASIEKPREFRFGQSAPALAAGFMAVLCVAGAISMPLMPHSGPPAPLAVNLGISGFFLLGALFMASLGLQQTTRVLTLTDTSLVDRSLFGRREIPFDQVESVTTKELPTKSGTMEMTTVKSATTNISFPALLPNYDRLVQAIQARVGAKVAVNAPQAVVEDTKRYVRQNVIGLVIIGCLFGVALSGLAMMLMHDGQTALERQLTLDTQGKTTQGQVIGADITGSKSTVYSLNYSFEVDGKHYTHVSSVSHETYDQTQVGSTVGVVYLPTDPEVSRATLSIAKENAEGKIKAAKGMIAIGCGLPFLFGVLAFTQKPRYRPTAARTLSR